MMSKIQVSQFYLAVVSSIFPKVDEVYDWLERNRPNLLGPVQRRLEGLRASHNKANETLSKAWCDPDDQSIDTSGPVKDCITYCVVLQEVLADTAATLRTDLDKKTTGASGGKAEDTKARFSFNGAQAFFDRKDLELPISADVQAVEILKKLVESFGKVVAYNTLDNSSKNTADESLRRKITTIRAALKKHKVPCKIQSRKWSGYVLSNSRAHS